MNIYKITYQTMSSKRTETAYLTSLNRRMAMDLARELLPELLNILTIDEQPTC